MSVYSLYLHIPFCQHRCSYCDFNTYAGLDDLVPAYVQALCREIELAARSAPARLPVQTVFFGGGTPSLLPPASLAQILDRIAALFDVRSGVEITLEANPGTVDLAYWRELRKLGINRISLGMQSALQVELRLLERQHDVADVEQAVLWARQSGFENLNLDLIFGLPFQTVEQWSASLEHALSLEPEHLALYGLTLEHGTPLQHQVALGLLPEPDPDLAAEMYELASDRLAQAGFEQYEISNWARRASSGELLACRHNLQYWRNLPYLGFGAGAHGYAAGLRTANVLAPAVYIQRCLNDPVKEFPRTPATVNSLPVGREAEIGETMMMGLRLTQEGVGEAAFQERFGKSLAEVFPAEIDRLVRLGLLELARSPQACLRLTPRGRLLGNQVFVEFI